MSVKTATARLEGDGLRLVATTGSGHTTIMDDAEGNAGPRPAEVLIVTRTFTFDLAWVAHGPISHVRDQNADLKLTGWDSEATLTGVVDDSAGLITFGDLDYAAMLLGNYVIQ